MHIEEKLASHDGKLLHFYLFSQVINPIGIVQIVHGMNEHGLRYIEFARFLNRAGFIVCIDDHRGSGKTVTGEWELGHLEPGNGFFAMVKDQRILQLMLQSRFPNIPHFFFAHSMGSFLMRYYMTKYETDGVILSGSGLQSAALLRAGSRFLISQNKKHHLRRSHLLHRLVFLGYNRTIKDKHPFSWLTSEKTYCENYQNDPFGGLVIGTFCFFENLLRSIIMAQSNETFLHTPPHIPILLLSGSDDPVGHWGKDIPKLAVKLVANGADNVTYKIYEKARHELINETCRETVYTDICNWLYRQIKTEQ